VVPGYPTNETGGAAHKQQAEEAVSAVSWITWPLIKTDARDLQEQQKEFCYILYQILYI
jgi:hypothetical protein